MRLGMNVYMGKKRLRTLNFRLKYVKSGVVLWQAAGITLLSINDGNSLAPESEVGHSPLPRC